MAPLGRKSKKDIADSQRLQSAMDDLFPGQDVRNMTGRGYLKALKDLRSNDSSAADRVDRTLDKEVLPRILPRRTLGPIDTSWGLKARLALLPSNPHFAQDVALIRKIFELPQDWLDSSYGKELAVWTASALQDNATSIALARDVMAQDWLTVHEAEAEGNHDPEPLFEQLPTPLAETAKATALMNLQEIQAPPWVGAQADSDSSESPFQKVCLNLLRRHRLPDHIIHNTCMCVLTSEFRHLDGLEFLGVSVTNGPTFANRPRSFDIQISGIDEFVNKQDWDAIFDRHVQPTQKDLWENRGQGPQGKAAPDIKRLFEYLPLYKKMVTQKLSVQDIFELAPEGFDESPIQRAMGDLRELLAPDD
jgi:hypothetical protein